MTKMRKGQSRSFNNWLRVRIIAQGLTVAAVVAGSWAYGTAKSTNVPDVSAAQDKAAQEREEFQMRLRLAEEATRIESDISSTKDTQSFTSVAVPEAVLPSASTTTSTSWRSWWKWNDSKGSSDRPS
jgi:Hypoxia induced protein conserved region